MLESSGGVTPGKKSVCKRRCEGEEYDKVVKFQRTTQKEPQSQRFFRPVALSD